MSQFVTKVFKIMLLRGYFYFPFHKTMNYPDYAHFCIMLTADLKM